MQAVASGKSKHGYIIMALVGIICAIGINYALLITSAKFLCYNVPGYFETEYAKHDVLSNLPEMTMSEEDGLMAVTNHMMKYLIGDKDTPELQIEVMMGGERRGFFTDRELAHMWDCKNLFHDALQLRKNCVLGAALLLLVFGVAMRKEKGVFLKGAGTGFVIGTAIFLIAFVALGIGLLIDFNTIFVTFHHIFFNNDLWILDTSKDMLVNIVPEGFFFDTAKYIVIIFIGTLLVFMGISISMIKCGKKQMQENKK